MYFGQRSSFIEICVARSVAVWMVDNRDQYGVTRLLWFSLQCFTAEQQAQIAVWEFWALVGNDFMTDDTYVVRITVASIWIVPSLPVVLSDVFL